MLDRTTAEQTDEQVVFVSEARWHQDNEHVLVVACPDPRFREARGEFIDARYGLRRYDPLIVPGGPLAVLPLTPNAFLIRDMVTLLDDAHGFERIIGISALRLPGVQGSVPLAHRGAAAGAAA